MSIQKRLVEINKRTLEIRDLLDTNEELDKRQLDKINAELRAMDLEERELRSKLDKPDKINNGLVSVRMIDRFVSAGMKVASEDIEGIESRGKDLKEMRAITVGSSQIVLPQHQSSTINPTFNEVSSLVDRVSSEYLLGGETFDQPYEKGTGEGDYTSQGSDYTDTETLFDRATINKTKITAYQEEPEEVVKLPNADYDSRIVVGVRNALRKKLTKEILVGDGGAGHFVGIFSPAATAIDAATDIEITEINEFTLDEIIYSFGGDEDVEDVAVLILNKNDLKAFATLRDADGGKKVYTVVNHGNTGTIDGVPFIINSACKAISAATVVSGEYCMAYGPLSNYKMAIFSDIDIQRSTDFKFKQGMIAHKGSVFAGGNVAAYNGFLRVKKA